jgi:sulfhydrogenase subunit gamma (sulfur reductase)
MKEHSYIPRVAVICERRSLSRDSVGLRLSVKDKKPFNFQPGQFVMLSVFGFGEIPIGITSSPDEKGYFEVAIRSVGMVSQKICALSVGDEIGVNGPFGNGFKLSSLKGKDIVIISGGIGLFPIRSLIHHVGLNKKIVKSLTILIGSKSPESLLFRDEYKKWGKFASVQVTGMITKLFDRVDVKRGAVMIVCGPPVMYRSVIDRYAGKRISDTDLYFLLERRMKCGIGKCQHCTCGNLYVCSDGPIFSYDKIKYNDEAFK